MKNRNKLLKFAYNHFFIFLQVDIIILCKLRETNFSCLNDWDHKKAFLIAKSIHTYKLHLKIPLSDQNRGLFWTFSCMYTWYLGIGMRILAERPPPFSILFLSFYFSNILPSFPPLFCPFFPFISQTSMFCSISCFPFIS